MAKIFGQNLTKREILARVGDVSSIAGAREYEITTGPARGMRAIEVTNGAGLSFTVLPDRNMDISFASYNGMPISYISKVGEKSPYQYEEDDFLRNFTAGLMTTCGLTYNGAPCEDNGKKLGLHGRIGNAPAYDVSVTKEWVGDDYVITLRGTAREACVFAENMENTKTIIIKMGENKINIENKVENLGFDDSDFMLLYHINLGYPLVDDKTGIRTNCTYNRPISETARKAEDRKLVCEAPTHGFAEQCFLYDAPKDAYAEIFNDRLGYGVRIAFDGSTMTNLVEWKMMGESEYVIGLEPANCSPEGRVTNRNNGMLKTLKAGESTLIKCSVEILTE